MDTSRLTFEITESTYVNNTEAVNRVIRGLKQHNIQISMDDFGSGYSSLNTLKDLLFNEVKIGRKFLGDSLTENAKIVLQEVFHMLKRMGKSRDSCITVLCVRKILKSCSLHRGYDVSLSFLRSNLL